VDVAREREKSLALIESVRTRTHKAHRYLSVQTDSVRLCFFLTGVAARRQRRRDHAKDKSLGFLNTKRVKAWTAERKFNFRFHVATGLSDELLEATVNASGFQPCFGLQQYRQRQYELRTAKEGGEASEPVSRSNPAWRWWCLKRSSDGSMFQFQALRKESRERRETASKTDVTILSWHTKPHNASSSALWYLRHRRVTALSACHKPTPLPTRSPSSRTRSVLNAGSHRTENSLYATWRVKDSDRAQGYYSSKARHQQYTLQHDARTARVNRETGLNR